MLKKVFSFLAANRKKVIIITLAIIIVIGILIFFLLFKEAEVETNEIVKLQDGEYANDLSKAFIFQEIETNDIKFKIYGENASYNNKDYYLSMNVRSKGAHITDNEYDLEGQVFESSKIDTYELKEEPIEVCNHCVFSITQKLNPSLQYDIKDVSWNETLYMNANIELPDGSLITISSYNNPLIQVNIYENETRVVIGNGIAYFRILKQEKNKIFTVQIANKIFGTKDGAELLAYSNFETINEDNIENIMQQFNKKLNSNSEFIKLYDDSVTNKARYSINEFYKVKGTGQLLDRTFTDRSDMLDDEYVFLHYYLMGGRTVREGNSIYVMPSEYVSDGFYNNDNKVWGVNDIAYDFLNNQKQLNNMNLNFEKIYSEKQNINEIINSYNNYFKQNFNENIESKKQIFSTFYVDEGWTQKTCSTYEYYYVPTMNACCNEGYQPNLLKSNCSKYTQCPVGYNYVSDRKCCSYGYILSDDKTTCIGIVDSSLTKEYVIENLKNYTGIDETKEYSCVEMTSLTGKVFCPSGSKTTLGAYVSKDGKCCY